MRDYPIDKTRNIGIIAHIDVPICFAQSAISKSRILDFCEQKSGPENL